MDRMRGCARPGCGASPAATLTYDYATRTAWLDSLGEAGLGAWTVCAVHAEATTVPVGWGLHDRRRGLHAVGGSLAS
jgi:uncharacterized protein DUF3499